MRFFKCIFALIIMMFVINVNVLAKSENITVEFQDNSIELTLSSDYVYFTANDVDKQSADYFKNMPVDKKQARELVKDGTYFSAFSEKNGSQITINITSDSFTQTVENFTPMDDNDKLSVIKSFKSILEREGHSFLSEPSVTEIDGYDFIEFNCRIGSGDIGYSYKSYMTIIGGNCYELVCYNKMSIPDDEITEQFSEIVSSVEMNIKGETAGIIKSFAMSAFTIIGIIIAVIIVIAMIYSLIREFIVHKNHSEKVKIKKRQ